MVRVLIVGAGVTGALCAHMLRRHLPSKLQCQIIVWEKSRGIGGRMSLSKAADFENCSAELGAQYVTQHQKYLQKHKSFFDELLDCDVIQPISGSMEGFRSDEKLNFVSQTGLSTIPKHYFAKSCVEMCSNIRLQSLRLVSDDKDSWNVWEASTTSGKHDHFDAVIMTIPTPQILAIDGVNDYLNDTQKSDLESAEYSSRFAIGLFYDKSVLTQNFPYISKYVKDSNIIRYIAIDQAKRGMQSDTASIVVHTSVPYGKAHLEEDVKEVGSKVVEELNRIIPDLPEPSFIKHHKWRYSQVSKSTETYGSIVVVEKPLLLFAGDAFTHSNLDGCIESALSVDEHLENWVKGVSVASGRL